MYNFFCKNSCVFNGFLSFDRWFVTRSRVAYIFYVLYCSAQYLRVAVLKACVVLFLPIWISVLLLVMCILYIDRLHFREDNITVSIPYYTILFHEPLILFWSAHILLVWSIINNILLLLFLVIYYMLRTILFIIFNA